MEQEPRVGVGVLVLRGDKILLIKRKYPPGQGRWSIPGGHVEPGESIYETAERELEEETGLKGRALGVINVDNYICREGGDIKYHYVLVTILVDAHKGKPTPGSDALEAAFIPLDEAKRMNLTISTRGLIDKLEMRLVSPEKLLHARKYETEKC